MKLDRRRRKRISMTTDLVSVPAMIEDNAPSRSTGAEEIYEDLQ
jgi:hypothetical protein